MKGLYRNIIINNSPGAKNRTNGKRFLYNIASSTPFPNLLKKERGGTDNPSPLWSFAYFALICKASLIKSSGVLAPVEISTIPATKVLYACCDSLASVGEDILLAELL